MAFNGNEGEMIDPAIAQKWIDNYQQKAGPGAIKAYFVGFRRLNELMGQGEAIGVRIYYGKDDSGVDKLLMVAVTPTESNIAKVDGSKTAGLVLDHAFPCPPYCHKGE